MKYKADDVSRRERTEEPSYKVLEYATLYTELDFQSKPQASHSHDESSDMYML